MKDEPKHKSDTSEDADASEPAPRGIRGFLARHKTLLWWGHSVYALGLGVMVVVFAAKGFEQARLLAATLGAAFLVTLFLSRIFGFGAERSRRMEAKKAGKVQFLIMTYVLKNLYQGMLFFVLPFYWKSSSIDSINGWFVFVLGVLALLSTMDLIFDHILMRYRVLQATFYGVTLFACVNLVIPALFPNVRTIVTLLTSAGLAVLAYWVLHLPFSSFKKRKTWGWLIVVTGAFVATVYVGRVALPPVPLYLVHGAVGPDILADDGRLALEVGQLHRSRLSDMFAVMTVALPGGEGDGFEHVWRFRDGDFRQRVGASRSVGQQPGSVRLTSALRAEQLPSNPVGRWTVDVITEDGQIAGRATFMVIE